MTAVLPEAEKAGVRGAGPRTRWANEGAAARPALWEKLQPWIYKRWLQTPLLVGIAGALFYDRYNLCKQYLFKYTDEDQAIMWYAAHELMNGRIHEPCFYGQDYNSVLEGWLSVPFLWMHMPFNVAVPLVTVILGLLPFLLLALVAWWRGHTLVSAACLMVPLIMPVRYGLITGMPRGFVTGLAIGIIPAILLLPPPARPRRATATGEEPILSEKKRPTWLRRTWPALRYFFAGLIAVFAVQINPNCLVLLAPVAVYAMLTTWREWKFWVFGGAGVLAGVPYLIYVYQFYHVYHEDYVVYLRDRVFTWSWYNYMNFLWGYVAPSGGTAVVLQDLIPVHISPGGTTPALFLVGAFSLVGLMLLIRLRVAGLAAGFVGVLLIFISFAYSRLQDGRPGNPVTFSYSRMYLGIPVLFVWLLFLVNSTPWKKFSNTPLTRWVTRGALVGLLVAAIGAVREKEQALPAVRAEALRAQICTPIAVDEVFAVAHEVQRVADETKADLVVFPEGEARQWVYTLPALTTCETLFPHFERRTWRLVDENSPMHANILLMGNGVNGGKLVGGGAVLIDADGNIVSREGNVGAGANTGGGGGGLAALFGIGNPPPPANRGGGRGGRGGGGVDPGAGGGGGRGRGGGRGGRGGEVFSDAPTRSFWIPDIMLVPTMGLSTVKRMELMGLSVPQFFTPRATPANPKPVLEVVRPSWMMR